MARSEVTALKANRYLGWATVTHPFHPLRGMRFEILECRTLNQQDIFSLKDTPYGSVRAVLREWTDRANPDPYESLHGSPPLLSFIHLYQLTDFIKILQKTKPKELDA